MRTLLLLRHGKSSWTHYGLGDHERPLNKRGKSAVPLVGSHMAQQGLHPQLVLSSDSVRTRETVALVLPELGGPAPEVVFENALYLAPPAEILDVVRAVGGAHDMVMVVGHNPGMHALALGLSGSGDKEALGAVAGKYPTSALAVITFDTDDWSKVKPGKGHLKAFVTPRALA